MSKFENQPEFAVKFREISTNTASYSGDAYDVGIAGAFGAVDADGNDNGLSKASVGIFVGTGGDLTFLPKGTAGISSGGVAGNYITLKNIPSGSFLPIIANRILIRSLTYISRDTNLGGLNTISNVGLADVAVGTYKNIDTSTSGSGTGLKVNINVYIDPVSGTKVANVIVNSSKHSGYAVDDTITVAADWGDDGGNPATAEGPSFTLTLDATKFSTKAATTADDIVIYY